MSDFCLSERCPWSLLLNPFSWLLWILDFVAWIITLGPIPWIARAFRGQKSALIARNKPADRIGLGALTAGGVNQVSPQIAPICKIKGAEDVETVHDLMQRSLTMFASRPAFGTRKYLGEHKLEGARFPLKMFGESSWLTYAEVGERARAFGLGLLKCGCEPLPQGADYEQTNGPHTILLWEDTCADWFTALMGCGGQSISVATSYATLGLDSVAQAINNSTCPAVVCNYMQAEKLAQIADQCPSLQTIIYTKLMVKDEDCKDPPKISNSKLTVISFDEVCELGLPQNAESASPLPDASIDAGSFRRSSKMIGAQQYNPPLPSTVSVIMYTSGSTGTPKGVMIKHESFVASVAGLKEWVDGTNLLSASSQETYLAYLPAAHILELVVEHALVTIGASMGFANPQTLSSKGACRMRPDGTINAVAGFPYPAGGIQEFRPSLLAGVPKVWDILKKTAEIKIGQKSPVVRWLMQTMFVGRAAALRQGRESPLFKLIFKKAVIGKLAPGLKAGVTGGGPCAADVQTFVRTAFAIPFVQGYALTETCCAGSVQLMTDHRNGVVGPPLSAVRIRLNDCTEVQDSAGKPYLTTDTVHGPDNSACAGRGEIWISGTSVSYGYFRLPDKTASEFVDYDGERWFKTGDIGLFTSDGCIRIIDRLKNLIKLKGGEYIAIENMEATYGTAGVVNALGGGLMCYGDGNMDRPVALVQTDIHSLENWAKHESLQYQSVEALCQMKEAEDFVLRELNKIGKAKLNANEILAAVSLLPGTGEMSRGEAQPPLESDPWTPQNGCLTATNKINRKFVQKVYESRMDTLIKKGIK